MANLASLEWKTLPTCLRHHNSAQSYTRLVIMSSNVYRQDAAAGKMQQVATRSTGANEITLDPTAWALYAYLRMRMYCSIDSRT